MTPDAEVRAVLSWIHNEVEKIRFQIQEWEPRPAPSRRPVVRPLPVERENRPWFR